MQSQWEAERFSFFGTPESIEAYREMVTWVAAQPRFHDAAKAEFQRIADGWLAAFAKRTVTPPLTDPPVPAAPRRPAGLRSCRAGRSARLP